MRILITGAAGFLGSHLCDHLLKDGHEVIGVDNFVTGSPDNIAHLADNDHFSFYRRDVSEYIFVPGKVDAILHFASPASPNPQSKSGYFNLPIQTMKAGALGTHNCLGLARAQNARFLLASTSEIYGDPEVHPQVESYTGNVDPIGTRAVYDEAKRFAESLTMAYHRSHNVNTSIVRIFNTYGPRMHPNDGRVVSNFIVQALRGEDITIYGDGSQTRSFCFYEDLIEGFVRLMASGDDVTGPINLGNPNEFTIRELAEAVLRKVGGKSKLICLPLPSDDPKQRQPNIEQAKAVLGWAPKVQLEDGLDKTIDYFRRFLQSQ